MSKDIYQKLNDKYQSIGEKPEHYLEGLYHSKPITYWDYVEVDTLLSLQKPRTNFKDESVFIMYHQINELLFKMVIHEMDQICGLADLKPEKFVMHLSRISRYFDMLSNSFTIMGDGMELEQYMKFRDTLTPASGFQSAQYRKIEIASTELINLIDYRFRKTIARWQHKNMLLRY